MHFLDNIWLVIAAFVIIFGLVITVLVKLASTLNK
jgi:hypothetical protein